MSSNSQGMVQVVAVEEKELQPSSSQVVTLEEVTNDRDRLEWLLYVFKHYRDLFDSVLFDCQQLSNYSKITYLIDFDVIRSYLEANTKGYDSIFINSIFYDSSQDYCIPIGAFYELLDYLSGITQTTHSITDQPIDLPREESVRQIAAALGVRNSPQLEEGEAFEEISKRLEQKALSLTRLLNMLTDPRYKGVVATYDENDKSALYGMLDSLTENTPRRKKPRGTKINERDAINLAIALMSIRKARAINKQNVRAETAAYVLISKTFFVTDLPDMLLKHDEESEDDSPESHNFTDHLWKLSNMVGLDPTLQPELNQQVIGDYFPVMHPRRVINAELLGVYESPGNALASAMEMKDKFRKLTDHLTIRAAVLKTLEDRNLYNKMTNILAREQMEIEGTFRDIAKTMLSPKLGGMYGLEQLRATSASVDYAHRLQQGDYVMSPKDEIKQKSTGLLELIGQVLSAFGNVPIDYRVEVNPPDAARPYSEFQIGEQSMAEVQPFVFGEKYNQTEPSSAVQVYYALRWPVSCPVNNFISSLTKFLVSRPNGSSMSSFAYDELPFSDITDNSTVWDEGVVVYANDKALGFPFNPALWDQEWELLDIQQVAVTMRKRFQSDNVLIQQYRINTSFGDFVFDIEPAEGEKTKYLTVISNYNLASQIALLYKNTGMLCALPDKLSDILSKALTEFAMVPETHRGGISNDG